MTNSSSSNPNSSPSSTPGSTQSNLHNWRKSWKRSVPIGIIAGTTIAIIGLIPDSIEIFKILRNQPNPDDINTGWIITKITGWGYTEYNRMALPHLR
jgi:hypothetical protein